MKILHLLASPFFTGPAEAVTQLALAQRALGHQVSVAIDRLRTIATSEELAAPRLEALQLAESARLELSVKSTPLGMLRDVLTLRALEHLDVVHAHFSHDHTLVRFGRPKGALVVRSIHAARSLRASTPAADAYTVPTFALARKLLGSPVMVLPPLVDAAFVPPTDRAALRARLALPSGPLVGMVSTFQPSRRHDVGLAAFAKLAAQRPDASLILVGDGERALALKAQAVSLRIYERIRFVGYQSGAAFVEFLQALDEVWILGLGNDFSGRAAAQARACGVRVVAVDEGALARNADALIDCDADQLAQQALAGTRLSLVVEGPAQIAARLVELYQNARKGRSP
jgi:glycosyltransferase involved in cell wall biosynthesis